MIVREMGTIVVVILVLVGVGAAFFTKKDDTVIEEAAEAGIKQITGFDIDLTPSSDEEDD